MCHRSGATPQNARMACCVAKYGHVGGSVAEALDDTVHDRNVGDTVCMSWEDGPGGEPPFARFFAFGEDGWLTPTTVFDTSGPRAVPSVCGHCHGRSKDWKAHGGDTGGMIWDAIDARLAARAAD